MDQPKEEPTVGELLSALARDTGTLVQKEVQLASSEMSTKARTAARHMGAVGAGGALAHAGLLTLIASLVLGLGAMVPMWLSALVIGALSLGLGYLTVQRGLSALHQLDPAPEQTLETLKDDKTWAKEQLHGNR